MTMIVVKSDRRNDRVLAQLRNTTQATRRALRQTWFELGTALKREANKEILRKPKSGRTYIVLSKSGRKRRHVASAPGETHANLSGDLRRSIGWQVHGTNQLDFGYGVTGGDGSAAARGRKSTHYAAFVEFGTSRMAERPSLNNAIIAVQPRVQGFFDAAFTREVGKK